jgi:hypothetical protein
VWSRWVVRSRPVVVANGQWVLTIVD